MRNYIKFAAAEAQAPGQLFTRIVGLDADDLATRVQQFLNQWPDAIINVLGDFYVLLDKETLRSAVQVGIPPGGISMLAASESPKHKAFWPSSDGPGPVKAVTGPGPKGTITMNISLYMALLVRTYQFERNYTAANAAMAILKDYLNKKITAEQALALVAKLPKTQ